MNTRFVAIILDPGHLYSDHGVVDLQRGILICRCSYSKHADEIAKVMNWQVRDREDRELLPPPGEAHNLP